MTMTVTGRAFSEGVWTVTVVVDDGNGTLVSPYHVELSEDATDADIYAAVDAIIYPKKPTKKTTKKPVVEPDVGADNGQDPSVAT